MIVINDNYYIDCDSLSYILKKKSTGFNKKGEPIKTSRTLGYFKDVQGCVDFAIKDTKLSTFRENNYSLEEAFKKIREINESFESQLNDIFERLEV